MNHKILLYILPLLLILSCSKDEISNDQAESFIKFFGTTSQDMGTDIKPLQSGGYALLGSVNMPDAGYQMYLAKTDKFGNFTEDPIIFGGPFADIAHAMQINSNGTIYIVGSTISERGGTSDMVLYIVTNTDITGPITFGGSGNEVGYHLQITETGIVMVGYSDEGGSKDIYLVVANRNGDEIWSKRYGHKTGEDIGRFVIPYNGNYLITGSTNYDARLNVRNNKNIWLLEIAPENRSPVNSVFISGPGDDEGIALLPLPDGTIYLTGTVTDDENNPGAYLAQFDQNLKMNWERSYHEINAINTSGICLWNSNIVVAGTHVLNESNSRISVLVLDKNGELSRDYYIGGQTRLSASSVEMTTDQGLILSGTNENRGASMITIIKLDQNGNL